MKTEQETGISAEQRTSLSTEERKTFSLDTCDSELISLTEFRFFSEEFTSSDHNEEPMRKEMRKEMVALRDEVSSPYREIHTIPTIQNMLSQPKEELFEDLKSVSPQINNIATTIPCSHSPTPSPPSTSPTPCPPISPLTSSPPSPAMPSLIPSPPGQFQPKREVLIPKKTAKHTAPIKSGREHISCEKNVPQEKEVDQLFVTAPTEGTITAITLKKGSHHDTAAIKIAQTTKMVLQAEKVATVRDEPALKKPMSKKDMAPQNYSFSTINTGPSDTLLDSSQVPVPPASAKVSPNDVPLFNKTSVELPFDEQTRGTKIIAPTRDVSLKRVEHVKDHKLAGEDTPPEEVEQYTKKANNIVEPSKLFVPLENTPAALQSNPQPRVTVTKQVTSQKNEEHSLPPSRETQSKKELQAVSFQPEAPKEQTQPPSKSSPKYFSEKQDSQKTKQSKYIEEPIPVKGIL